MREMIFVDAIQFQPNSPYPKPYITDQHNDCRDIEDIELMQFTGLKDKNGKEIYEGDILRNNYSVRWNQLHCGWALYNAGDFCVDLLADEYNRVEELLPPWHLDIDIIGNIYENPELLK
jgi:uncharacterized phage protein (TIGR01671 family)